MALCSSLYTPRTLKRNNLACSTILSRKPKRNKYRDSTNKHSLQLVLHLEFVVIQKISVGSK
ncbi:hypothetical protein V1478_014438 [Vespula squamosa]|uniref:Ribosomal protein L33 n=1 Tax=Vespula squamosa TaxID=30214 RepID=A0ABD2A807_VESSQ